MAMLSLWSLAVTQWQWEGWVQTRVWRPGRCPGWRDAFGSRQCLDKDKNHVFGTSSAFFPSSSTGLVLGRPQECPGDPRMHPWTECPPCSGPCPALPLIGHFISRLPEGEGTTRAPLTELRPKVSAKPGERVSAWVVQEGCSHRGAAGESFREQSPPFSAAPGQNTGHWGWERPGLPESATVPPPDGEKDCLLVIL